ncbi:hypothetical protein ABPG75_011014 [Micractinium tetrahymenae]
MKHIHAGLQSASCLLIRYDAAAAQQRSHALLCRGVGDAQGQRHHYARQYRHGQQYEAKDLEELPGLPARVRKAGRGKDAAGREEDKAQRNEDEGESGEGGSQSWVHRAAGAARCGCLAQGGQLRDQPAQ